MNLDNLEEILKSEPKYRIAEVNKYIYKDLISDWDKATSLPLALREKLKQSCPLEIKAEFFVSDKSESKKALITLEDGCKIESVLMKHNDGRNTVCVSSQVGCPLNCEFCATGKMGFKRNLKDFEIVEQVIFFARKEKITNVVFMGMGEPFLNYENVISAIKILNSKFNLGARHFSISTAGITEGIEKLSEEKLQINLAISLHGPNDILRNKLMPINKKYPIEKILNSVNKYILKTNRRVMIEYILINNLNDKKENAKELSDILKKYIEKPIYFVNLICYNSLNESRSLLAPSKEKTVFEFQKELKNNGIDATVRHRFGDDIMAACGQLANKL